MIATPPRPGIALIALSAFWFSIMGLCMKQLRVDLGAMEVVFFRSVISLVLTLLTARGGRQALAGVRRGLLLLRGLSGFGALWCYVVALGVIPYAEAAALLYTGPVFTALFASWFLDERMPRAGWLALAVCLCGSLLVLRPDFAPDGASGAALWGGAAALLAGVFSGVAYTSVRACARTDTDAAILLWFACVATAGSSVLMAGEFTWPSAAQWGWIAGMGACAQLGQVYLTRGLRAQAAGTAMTGAFVILVLASLWGWLWFDERPTWSAVAGGLAIVASIVLLSRRG